MIQHSTLVSNPRTATSEIESNLGTMVINEDEVQAQQTCFSLALKLLPNKPGACCQISQGPVAK
jgi:hypothetical protein